MKPYLKAEFLLENDRPVKLITTKFRHDHFKILLSIGDLPGHAYSVTYRLHESFYNPVREVFEKKEFGFPLQISTYGEFLVRAEINSPSGVSTVAQSLTAALRERYGDSCPLEIDQVIKQMQIR